MRSANQEQVNNDYLVARVRDLENKVEHLRVSRRVLMNLVIHLEQDKAGQICRLQEENRRLQKANARFAMDLLQKNRQIVEMENRS